MWRPSLVAYAPMSGLMNATEPSLDIARGFWPCSAASTSDDNVHIAIPSSDTSTTLPLPVRVRSSSAAAMPNARAIAPLRSPIAPRWPIGRAMSGGVNTCAIPPRDQNADASYPGASASGPRDP